MPRSEYTVVTAQELREIAERAVDAIFLYEEVEDLDEDFDRRVEAGIAVLRYVAVAASFVGAYDVLPLIDEAIPRIFGREFGDVEYDEIVASGLRSSLTRCTAVIPEMFALAHHEDVSFRRALARSLRPFDDEAVQLLRELATDGDPEVRSQARIRLSGGYQVPPWWGLFEADPLAGPSGADATFARAVERAIGIWSEPWGKLSSAEELVASIDPMPDEVASPLLAKLLRRLDLGAERLAVLMYSLMMRPGSETSIWPILLVWHEEDPLDRRHAAAFSRVVEVPAERRVALCRLMLEVFDQPMSSGGSRSVLNPEIAARWTASNVVKLIWPAEVSPRPVLEAILGCPLEQAASQQERDGNLYPLEGLGSFFSRGDLDLSELIPPMIGAYVDGYPGAWKSAQHIVKAQMTKMGDRRIKEEALTNLEHGSDTDKSRAMSYLTGLGHDPETDPSVEAMLEGFYEDPTTRTAFFTYSDHFARLLPRARADLRKGRLTFDEAVQVLMKIDRLYGGAKPVHHSLGAEPEARRQSRREELAEWLGPEDLRGPITAEEWDLYRALRTAAEAEAPEKHKAWWYMDALSPMPPGPWYPEDLAFARRGLELWKRSEVRSNFLLLDQLLGKPSPETDEIVNEIVQVTLSQGGEAELGFCLHFLRAGDLPSKAVELIRKAAGAGAFPEAPNQDRIDDEDEEE